MICFDHYGGMQYPEVSFNDFTESLSDIMFRLIVDTAVKKQKQTGSYDIYV